MQNISNRELETLRNIYRKQKEEKDKKIRKLCSNDDYLLWLKKFTIMHTSFRSDDKLLHTYKISHQDRENIDKLELLYEGIEDYAENEEIFPKLTTYGNCYSLYYKRTGYYIGRCTTGTKDSYCCTRVSEYKLIDPIDFSELKDYNRQRIESSVVYQKCKK